MNWLRYGLLAILALTLCVSAVISGYRHTEDMKQLAALQKSGVWAVAEMDREINRFLTALELIGLDQRTHDQLMLRYDLLWSRLQVMQTGSETAEIRQLPGAIQVIIDTELALREVEAAVLTFKPGDSVMAGRIASRFDTLVDRSRMLVVDSFNIQSQPARALRILGMAPTFALAFLGTLVSGLLLTIMLVREGWQRRQQAIIDELTGIPNRHYFNKQLLQLHNGYQRQRRQKIALLLVDLNEFKEVNDGYGHAAGDQILAAVASRLQTAVGADSKVARVGGDEFAIVLQRVDDFEQASMMAQRIIEFIARPEVVDGVEIFISASVGIGFYPDDSDDIQQVLSYANTALVRAKLDSGGSYRLFEPAMNEVAHRRKRLADDLRPALLQGDLRLFYQPVVELETGRICGVEALMRWHHDELGFIPPPEVVSIAEQHGLALELNEWVLNEACRQNKKWQNSGLPPMLVWVNISPAMYTRHDLVASIIQALVFSGLEAQWLGVEVTEDTTMRDIETSPGILRRLQELGVPLALDDFGTGYSSLSHLKRLPVNRLKIDRSFINDLNNQPCDLRFIRTLLNLAEQLGLSVVAEGIENQHQLSALRGQQCECGQGDLFSRPLPAEELEEQLRNGTLVQLPKQASGWQDKDAARSDNQSSGSEDELSYYPQSSTTRH